MKKPALISFFICLTISAFTQSGFHAGIQGSFNSTWILNQNNYGFSELDYDLKFGATPGVALGYNFTPKAGVQIEIDYAIMGQNYFDRVRDFGPVDGIGRRLKVDTYRYIKLNYIQFPVLGRFQTPIGENEKIVIHAMAGPVIGILLSADQYYEADVEDNGEIVLIDYAVAPESLIIDFLETPDVEEPIAYFQKPEAGILMDLGIDILLETDFYISPAFRLYYGLTDINSEPTRNVLNYTASHNAFVGLSVGIHYMYKKK